MPKIMTAVGGSAADPPHKGHRTVLRKILTCGLFDRVVWIVSGDRNDKRISVCPNDRIAMTELMIPRAWRAGSSPDLVILYDDIYSNNTSTIDWLEKYLPVRYPDGEFYWFTGSDSVVPRRDLDGKCEIEARWLAGRRLYRYFPFIVFQRGAYPLNGVSLPKNFMIMSGTVPDVSSSYIRRLIADGRNFESLLPKAVADYIKRHGLYGYKDKKENGHYGR